MPLPVADKQQLVAHLTERGFSRGVAQWTATNLERTHPGGGLQWGFDLDGIKEMYADYEATDLWNVVEAPPQGLDLNFIRAERSTSCRRASSGGSVPTCPQSGQSGGDRPL